MRSRSATLASRSERIGKLLLAPVHLVMLAVSLLALAGVVGRRVALRQAGGAALAFTTQQSVSAFGIDDSSKKTLAPTSDALTASCLAMLSLPSSETGQQSN